MDSPTRRMLDRVWELLIQAATARERATDPRRRKTYRRRYRRLLRVETYLARRINRAV